MAITWTDVTNLAPNAAKLPTSSQNAILAAAGLLVNAAAWGALADLGSAYLAAHLATLALNRGGGAITNETVGPLSIGFSAVQGIKGSLGLSSYGAEYQRLSRLLPTVLGAVP